MGVMCYPHNAPCHNGPGAPRIFFFGGPLPTDDPCDAQSVPGACPRGTRPGAESPGPRLASSAPTAGGPPIWTALPEIGPREVARNIRPAPDLTRVPETGDRRGYSRGKACGIPLPCALLCHSLANRVRFPQSNGIRLRMRKAGGHVSNRRNSKAAI